MMTSQRGGIIFRLLVLLFLFAFFALVYLLRHPLLRAAGEFWVVEDSLQTSDAILLLSDDNFQSDRASRAAELYRAGWAPRVVASGRQLRPYAGLAEFMRRDLVERGVPGDAVIVFPHRADNTRDEALAVKPLVVERGWRRVLVVTSNYHTRRARYIYRRVFGPAIDVRVAAANDHGYEPDHWWQSRRGFKLFFRELGGFPFAIWELRHGPESSQQIPAPSANAALAPAHP